MNILRIPQAVLFIAVAFLIAPALAGAAPVEQKNPLFPVKAFVSAVAETYETMPTMGVYLLTFTLTATGEDAYLPASTERLGKQVDMRTKGIEYALYDGADERLSKGISASALIADVKAVNGFYKVAKGASEEFTLLVIFDAPAQDKSVGEAYSMKVHGLRYSIREAMNKPLLETNGLEQWKTKEIQIAD